MTIFLYLPGFGGSGAGTAGAFVSRLAVLAARLSSSCEALRLVEALEPTIAVLIGNSSVGS
jgi:hypothetical protein